MTTGGGGGETLDIATEPLVAAQGLASSTAVGSAAVPVVVPPPTAVSALDGVAVSISTAMEASRLKVDATDTAAAQKQLAALTESPPVLITQDQQGAADITGSVGKIWTT